MAQDIPVYLFTGFMDSGKTTLVEETLFENNFGDGSKGIIIMCEDGEKEYDEAKLATINFKLVTVEEEEDFTPAKLQEIQDTYQPEQIFIEYNGTWGMDKLLEAKMPEGWVIVQSLATVDSTTYDLYMNNMRAMMQEQVFSSDVVIFNRTDDDTDRGHLRRTIKNINRKAQIVYERKDGTIDERPEELPFDIFRIPCIIFQLLNHLIQFNSICYFYITILFNDKLRQPVSLSIIRPVISISQSCPWIFAIIIVGNNVRIKPCFIIRINIFGG